MKRKVTLKNNHICYAKKAYMDEHLLYNCSLFLELHQKISHSIIL